MAEYNESQINSNETERIAAEQQRINNEAQRQTKETEREAREATRQSNESTRISEYNTFMADAQSEYNSFITNVENAEDERIANEQSRVQAEASRVNAENSRGVRLTELENDLTSAKMYSGTVTDSYKFTVDHDGMMPSLVTLDNIMGSSEIKISNLNERKIVNTKIKSICTVDVNSKNYFEDAIWLGNIDGAEYTRDGNDITVFRLNNYQGNPLAYACISLDIPTLTEGKKYCLFCDEVIINDGASAVEIHSGGAGYDTGQTLNSRDMEHSSFNKIFVYSVNRFEFRLHCTVGSSTGNVTYKNIQIYEVKEMTIPDIQLNSLPNGVKDEIKDGMLIKRTGYANLGDLEWNSSAYNNTYPNAGYRIYYAYIDDLKLPASYEDENKIILCNMLECKSFNYTVTLEHPAYNIPAISGHPEKGEIRIKLETNDAADLESLRTWLSTNNVSVVYELNSPEYIPVNLTIKADKGDTVVINTTKTMDLTYDIQLNTRAQIDTLQTNINKYTHSEYIPLSGGNVTGTIKPSVGYHCDLGSSANGWNRIYSYPFNMFVEDNGFTSQLKPNRGNFRIVDGYDISVLSWSHDYYILGPDVTNAINLGSGDYRFKSIYLNAQPNVSSDRTLKENIKYVNSDESDVSYEDMYAFVKDDLELATYNLVEHDKLNMGFIAQDLLVNLDGTDNKVGQMIVNPVAVPTEEEIEEGKPYPTLSYDTGMYTSVLAGALKEAINKIEQLEARINELENKNEEK